MYCVQFAVVLAAASGLAESGIPLGGARFERLPAIQQADPADSLYRSARELLNRRDYRGAAAAFGRIPELFPRSGHAQDAFYWQAFALYRLGGNRELRLALDALRRQRDRFPKSATQGDAAALERRIQGELAQIGRAHV